MEFINRFRPFESRLPTNTMNLAQQLWEDRNNIGAEPIELPVESSYGLPVLIGLREVTNPRPEFGPTQHGYVIGLFEDRRKITTPTTLNEIVTDPLARFRISIAIDSYSFGFEENKLPDTPVAAVEPLGWRVLQKNEHTPDGLVAHTSTLIGKGEQIAATNLDQDPYFLNFSKKHDINAITVGFEETFLSKRKKALDRQSKEVRKMFKDYTDWTNLTESDYPRLAQLKQRLHVKAGLGTLLTDLSIIISKKLGYTKLYIEVASYEAETLLASYQKNRGVIIKKSEVNPNNSYVIQIPK